MKKLEKDIIFKDLDFINNEISIKTQKLNSIISLFMEQEKNIIEDNIKDKNKKQFEEQQRVIQDDNEQSSNSDNTEQQNDQTDEIKNEEINNSQLELPQDIKTIYRKIVMITHPDKNINNHNSELYSDFYKRSIKAKDDNDISEILYIAYKLNINEVYDVDDEHFNIIKSKINDLKSRSGTIDMNSFWVWYHTDNVKLKRIMVEQITKLTSN